MFYAVLSLLAIGEHQVSKHSGVITIFDREFVKKGIFEQELSKWLHEAFDLRQRADYTEMFSISKDRALMVLNNAINFIAQVKKEINKYF